ncbi:MAG: CehA/McbA family metallohydrolase [Bryobacteraceae bacterium]
MINKHSRSFRIRTLLAAAFATALYAHHSLQIRGGGEFVRLARQFQDTAIRQTRDQASDRRAAIDLYWKAYRLAGRKERVEEALKEVGQMHRSLKGTHISRVTLTADGLTAEKPAAGLLVSEGRIADPLQFVLTNQTRSPASFAIAGTGTAVDVVPEQAMVAAGSSTSVFVRMAGRAPGNYTLPLRASAAGKEATVPVDVEVRPVGRLAVRVLDAAGRPTAARVFLTGADGLERVPEGSFERVIWLSGEHYFHADGAFQTELPAGDAEIEIVKGFHYRPWRRRVTIDRNQTTTLDARLEYLENMNARGWYSGDEHIHGNYRGEQITRPEDNFLVIRGEDLNVANLMVSNSDGGFVHDESYFTAAPHPLSTREHVFQWNQEMRNKSLYGHLILLNLKELVRPIYTGFPNTPNWEDYPSNYQLAMKAKEQGGYAAYAHPQVGLDRIPSGSDAKAAVVDVALGAIDAMEVFCSHDEPSMEMWYRFLNTGFHVALSAGSDAFINQSFTFVAGGVRSYVHTGAEVSYKSWIDGLRRGRSFATAGPLLFFEVEDQLPGHEFRFAQGPVTLKAKARVLSNVPVERLEIVANGKVMATSTSGEWSGSLPIEQSAWLAARVWGPRHRLVSNSPSPFAETRSSAALLAHTSPHYVAIGNQRVFSAKDQQFLLRWVDSLIQEVQTRGQFSTQERRAEVVRIFERARAVYERLP